MQVEKLLENTFMNNKDSDDLLMMQNNQENSSSTINPADVFSAPAVVVAPEQSEETQEETEEEEDQKLYCLCRQPDDFTFMIQCDRCENWFHGRCVGVSQRAARNTAKWCCPQCAPESTMTDSRKEMIALKLKNQDKEVVSKTDVMRQKARVSLLKSLTAARVTYDQSIQADNKSGYTNEMDLDAMATQFENAIYAKSASNNDSKMDAYKQKVMSMYVNAKAAHNARKLFDGIVTLEEFVDMTAEELADETLKAAKRKASEQSMRDRVLTEEMSAVILKKTKIVDTKDVISKSGTPIGMNDYIFVLCADINAGSTPRADISSPKLTSKPEAAALKIKPDTVKIVKSRQEREQSVNLLDDLLAKVNNTSNVSVISMPPTSPGIEKKFDSMESLVKYSSRHSLVPTYSPTQDENVCWAGKVSMTGSVSTQACAVQIGGHQFTYDIHQQWMSLLPPILDVSGRIPHSAVNKYVGSLLQSSSRNVMLISMLPTVADDNEQGSEWREFYDCFYSRKRCAVIGNSYAGVRDFYIVPVAKDAPLPDFVTALGTSMDSKTRDTDLLIGVVVTPKIAESAAIPDRETVKQELMSPLETPALNKASDESTLALLSSLMSQGVVQMPQSGMSPNMYTQNTMPPSFNNTQYAPAFPPAGQYNNFGYAPQMHSQFPSQYGIQNRPHDPHAMEAAPRRPWSIDDLPEDPRLRRRQQ